MTLELCFEISNDIRRETNFDIEEIEKLDKYLASPKRKQFDLFSVESHTGLGSRTKPLLNEYIKRKVISGPTRRYRCPIHEIELKPVNSQSAECTDCEAFYSLEDCREEMIYELIVSPDKLPVPAGTTQIVHSTVNEEQPSIKKRVISFIFENAVFIFRALLIAGLTAWLIPRIFSPSEQPSTTSPTSSSPVPTITASPTAAVSATINGTLHQDSSVTLVSPQTPTARTES